MHRFYLGSYGNGFDSWVCFVESQWISSSLCSAQFKTGFGPKEGYRAAGCTGGLNCFCSSYPLIWIGGLLQSEVVK